MPGSTYSVRVAAKDNIRLAAVERASPEFVSVDVGQEDISGISFVVFEQPEATILSGHVEGDGIDLLQPHLSVEIRSAADPSRIESVVPVPFPTTLKYEICPKASILFSFGLAFHHIHIYLNRSWLKLTWKSILRFMLVLLSIKLKNAITSRN